MENFSILVGKYSLSGAIENPGCENIVVMVHGFTGDMRGPSHLFEKFSYLLQKNDFSVCRFSFLGTPPSEGNFGDMTVNSQTQELQSVLQYLRELGYKKIHILGESMGGSIICNLGEFNFESLTFWYTAFDFGDTSFREFLSKKSLEELKEKRFLSIDGFQVGEKFISEIEKNSFYSPLNNISCPVLLLHGEKDSDVPYPQSSRAYKEILSDKKEIFIIPGAEHCFRNEQEEIMEITKNFLQKNS